MGAFTSLTDDELRTKIKELRQEIVDAAGPDGKCPDCVKNRVDIQIAAAEAVLRRRGATP